MDKDKEFYEEMFNFFRKVGLHSGYKIAKDENYCRDVFHDRVLKISTIESYQEVVDKLKGVGREFESEKNLRNFQYQIFLNAYKDEVKSAHYRYLDRSKRTEDEDILQSEDEILSKREFQDGVRNKLIINDEEIDPNLLRAAEKIFSDLSWEKRKLISLRYGESNSLEECARYFGCPIQTIDNRIKKAVMKVRENIDEILKEVDPQESRHIWELLVIRIHKWSKEEHER